MATGEGAGVAAGDGAGVADPTGAVDTAADPPPGATIDDCDAAAGEPAGRSSEPCRATVGDTDESKVIAAFSASR